MFNKFAKAIRWTVLAGMLYTLYVITIKDDIAFTNQSDEKTLVEIGQNASKNKDRFFAYRQLCKLYPENSVYKEKYIEILKQQANGLLDAHEKMLIPVPVGNYRYIKKIEFAEDDNGTYSLIFNLTDIFMEQDDKTKATLKKMFKISHHGIYKHYGFDDSLKLLLVPTYDRKDSVSIIDLGRKYEKNEDVPARPDTKDLEDIKVKASRLLDAHQKMISPEPIGNYKYIKSVAFGQYSHGDYVVIMNMNKLFDKEVISKQQEKIANLLRITHRQTYDKFGFDKPLKLAIVPTFHNLDDIMIIDLGEDK